MSDRPTLPASTSANPEVLTNVRTPTYELHISLENSHRNTVVDPISACRERYSIQQRSGDVLRSNLRA